MSSPSFRARPWRAVLAVLALALSFVGLTVAPAVAAGPPAVSISPTSAAPGVVQSFTVTVAATATSTAAQSVSITVPAGFSSPSLGSSWTKPEASWSVAGPTGSTWTFSGPSSDKLNGSEQLVATFTAVTPGTGTYTWAVSATTNGSTPVAGITQPTVAIGVVKQNQTISFDPIGTQTYGTGPLTLTATTTSGLSVSYAASGQCSVTGTSLSLTAAGSCEVTASQAGNASYFAAPDVVRSFTIAEAAQTITFDPIGTQTYGTGPLALTATGGGSGNPVTFTSTGTCTVTDDSLSLDAAGSCTVTAHQAGDDNYLAAPDVAREFTIAKAHAVLTLDDLSYTYDGQPHGATVTTTPDGLDGVTVTYDGSATEPTDAGSYAVHATLDNTNYEAESADDTLVIGKKPVTGSFTVADKEYDGSASATIDSCSVDGIESGDTVALDCSSATAAFDGVGAGSHTATVTGAVLNGPDADNYDLTGVDPASGTIDPKKITATLQAGDKVYDGDDSADATATLQGVLAADDGHVEAVVDSATFDDKNAGDDKTVTATVHLAGTAADNYELESTTLTDTASINQLHITGTFTADDKVYDGTTSAAVLTRGLVGALDGDDVSLSGGTATFDDADAATGKTVTLTGAGLDGADAGNYVLDSVATATADISPKALTATFTANDKYWDGFTTATVNDVTLDGVVAVDDGQVSLTGGAANFVDGTNASTSAVGTWNVIWTGFSLTQPGGNYTFAATSLTSSVKASILAIYSGTGFYAPVDMPTTTNPIVWNMIKGGQTVPLKFEIFSTQAGHAEQTSLGVFGADAFKVTQVTCTTSAGTITDDIELVTTGGTSLRYDTTGGQYIQNWKTPTGANTCYKVSVKTVDGSMVGPAYFWIKK